MGQGVLTRVDLLQRIADVVDTPVYVYDADGIRRRYRELEVAFAALPHRICYSIKANSNGAVLALLKELGAGADIVSGGELARALRAGFAPESIVFSGVGKRPRELRAALHAGVGLINIESAGELDTLQDLAERSGQVARFGIRVNPDVTAETHPYTQTAGRGIKFGVPLDQVVPLAVCSRNSQKLRLTSIGMHIGSQISDPEHFRRGAETMAELVETMQSAGIDGLESVDVGGGLAIQYEDGPALTATAFADAVRPLVERTALPLVLEPGRFLVGAAGVLLMRCLYRKHSGGKDLAVVDAGMNDLLRPSLYQARHEIRVVVPGTAAEVHSDGPVDVVGPLCESGDFLGRDRYLPGLEPGALLAVHGAGAYGFTMSSTYNSRPRPAEVLVDGGRWAVVRSRESVEDLWRGEQDQLEWTT